MTKTRQTITHLAVEDLTRHPDNIRREVGDLNELARSIAEHGILQPLTVTEHPDGGYLLIAGHRRLGAALMTGATRVPAVIRHGIDDPDEQLVLMIVENVQRRNLSPIEKADAYAALRNRGLTIAEISRRTGVQQSTISTHLTLLELDEDSRERVRTGQLNAGTAIAVVREHRQQTRTDEQRPQRGRPIVVEAPHFSIDHPLFRQVIRICRHTTRPKVGRTSCCGECWEAVIRADALGQPMPRAEEVA